MGKLTDPLGLINWGKTIAGAATNVVGMLSIYAGSGILAYSYIHITGAGVAIGIEGLTEIILNALHPLTPAGGGSMIGLGVLLLDIGSKAMIEGISEVEPQIELKKDNKTCK